MSAEAKAAADISELNLSYLLLVQRLTREDLATAMFRLGLSRELAAMIGNMSLSQIVRLANSGLMIFGFRLDEQILECAMTPNHTLEKMQQAHMTILLACQSCEAAVPP